MLLFNPSRCQRQLFLSYCNNDLKNLFYLRSFVLYWPSLPNVTLNALNHTHLFEYENKISRHGSYGQTKTFIPWISLTPYSQPLV
jgi:hypothetical protein